MDELIAEFSTQMGVSADELKERWAGRPDRIMEDLFQIPTDEGELAPLRLFPYQKKIVHAYFFGDASTLNVLKGRRIGGSFIIVLCLLLEGVMKPGMFYPIVATKEDQAFSRISDLKDLIENAAIEIPLEGKPTQSRVVLWNGSTFKAYTGAPKGARGDGARSVFIDEMAHVEDQDSILRAFRPMLALSQGKLIEVSTPLANNDRFMQTFHRGTETGEKADGSRSGVISIFQPTFSNYGEIDIERSLFEQELVPARPDLNISIVEDDRAEDPMGFAQEYLCQPVSEQYRFFDESSIQRAMGRGAAPGYQFGPQAQAQSPDSQLVLGVDVGIEHDETVVAAFEHTGDQRLLRYIEVIDNEALLRAGIPDPDRGNANHVAKRLGQLFYQLGADYLVIDKTGSGQTFPRIIEEHVGRGVIGFNFSDRKAVRAMFGEFNAGLRNDRVTLVENDRLYDQLCAIVREQKRDDQIPRFSGKDFSKDGRDDMAIACVLGAYPPGFEAAPVTEVREREDAYGQSRPVSTEGLESDVAEKADDSVSTDDRRPVSGAYATGSLERAEGSAYRRSYTSRYGRQSDFNY